MHDFRTEIVWREGLEFNLSAGENPMLTVATPPEFGGPENAWSPEELFVGSVGSCLLSTFFYFARRFELAVQSCTSSAAGKLEKTAAGLRFTGIDVSIEVVVSDKEAAEKADSLRLKDKLEKYCPVSASLDCPVRLELAVKERA